jgi:MoaA/NifB/PqqE/SkfB family radical SAM enzyme
MNAPQLELESQDLSFLWLEVTAKCNLECIHCYADSGPRQQLFGAMDREAWLTALRDAAALGCRQVQFIGGEPTLHPDLCQMIGAASAQSYDFIEVYTNATHIDAEMLHAFIQHGVNVATSFYSDDHETHDAITKRRGSFDRTVTNLRRLAEAGLRIRAGIIEMDRNRGHAERATEFLKNIGITDTKIDRQRGVGRGTKSGNPNPMDELCGECWKGKLCVTSSGSAYPCVFSRFAEVGRATEGIDNIVRGKPLSNFRTELRDYVTSSRDSAEPGCNPNCSPCEPGVFKCVPACRPSGIQNRAAIPGPATTQCGPTCNPVTCSPGDFKRCAPR